MPGINIQIEGGPLLGLAERSGALAEIRFGGIPESGGPSQLLIQAADELRAYFAGRLQTFSVPWRADGTEFQKRVWDEVEKIPYGRTLTYLDIARRLSSPGAVRAVGAANGANPLPILIPCHRVVATGGGMGGYGGGVDLKRRLLAMEGAILL